MKALTVKIGGTATAGDILVINYWNRKPRGGNSGLTYKVQPPRDEIVTDPVTGAKSVVTHAETPATMAAALYNEFTKGQQWPPDEFEFAIDPRNPDTLLIKAKETFEFANSDYAVEVHGAGGPGTETETMTLTVF